MNKLLSIGLLLQIPNIFILGLLGIIFIVPYITLALIFWILIGTIYGLINIASIILIVSGLLK
jgi:hypothetical protein